MVKYLIILLLPFTLTAQQSITLLPNGPAGVGQTKTTLTRITLPLASALTPSTGMFIFHYTESAEPGDEISIQGRFGPNAKVGYIINDGAYYDTLARVSQDSNYVKAQLPYSAPVAVYQVFVIDSTNKRSAVKYINKPHVGGFNSSIVYDAAKVSVMGKNLLLPGISPTIRFVDLSTAGVKYATWQPGGNAYKLNFIAPTGLTTGHAYTVYISNGYGNTIAETIVGDTLTAVAAAIDTFGIESGWHAQAFTTARIHNVKNAINGSGIAHVTGDGTTNDLPNLLSAANTISTAGGGVLYLPGALSGTTYKLAGSGFAGIDLPSNVVIMGDGPGRTILSYGTGSTISKMVYLDAAKSNSGLMNLSLVNTDATANFGAGLVNGNNFFMKNVVWAMGKGDVMTVNAVNNTAIINCQFTMGANPNVHGALAMSGNQHITIRGGTFTSVANPVDIENSKRVFMEDFTLMRDFKTAKNNSTDVIHVLVFPFISDFYVGDYKILSNDTIPHNTDGTPLQNDGESIVVENPNEDDYDYGTASGGSITTLVDASKSWSTSFDKAPWVWIVNGKGIGQGRKIVSRTTTTLTITPAWDVAPDASSSYTIGNYTLERGTFYNGFISNQQRGITLYDVPMHHINVVNTQSVNAGGIDITTIQIQVAKKIFTPVFDMELLNNRADASQDRFNGASIGLQHIQHAVVSPLGTVAINVRMKNNYIQNRTPVNNQYVQDRTFTPSLNAYGVFNNAGSPYVDNGRKVILGTIIVNPIGRNQDNLIHINTHSYHTSIKNIQGVQNTNNILDDTIPASGHSSVNTKNL